MLNKKSFAPFVLSRGIVQSHGMKYYRLISSVLIVIALCAISAAAQSGRRQNKPAPAAPVPSPTPEPTPTPKKQEKEAEVRFVVAVDRNTSFHAGYPAYFYRAAQRGCADRLRTGSSAEVDVADRDISRGEAVKRAKAETTGYVVLLSFSLDNMTARSYDDVDLNYVVFAPGTAKVLASGRTYQNASRAGPVIVSPPGGSTNAIFREKLLQQAGEDAANRILKALHMGV